MRAPPPGGGRRALAALLLLAPSTASAAPTLQHALEPPAELERGWSSKGYRIICAAKPGDAMSSCSPDWHRETILPNGHYARENTPLWYNGDPMHALRSTRS